MLIMENACISVDTEKVKDDLKHETWLIIYF